MPDDTTPTAAAVQLAVLRRLGPAARVALAVEMSLFTRRLGARGRDGARGPGICGEADGRPPQRPTAP